MNLRTMVAAAALLLVAATAESQGTPAALVGQVRDGLTGKPLPGAAVVIVGTSLGAITDSAGLFRVVHGELRGLREFTVRRVGYQSATDTVTLEGATSDLGMLILERSLPPMVWADRVPRCTEIRQRPDSLLNDALQREWLREYRRRDGRNVLELCRMRRAAN